jgi:hypothetical protein
LSMPAPTWPRSSRCSACLCTEPNHPRVQRQTHCLALAHSPASEAGIGSPQNCSVARPFVEILLGAQAGFVLIWFNSIRRCPNARVGARQSDCRSRRCSHRQNTHRRGVGSLARAQQRT